MFILFILFASGFQKLTLIQPQKLINKLGSDIKYSMANFGEIPWGERMIGTLIPTYPILGCESILPSQDHQFIFIQRGECTFVTKVRNAQTAGFKFVIIGDNINDDIDNNFSMLNDGTGSSINIPSIIVGSKWTKEFQDIFKNKNNTDYSENTIKLLMKFDIIKQDIAHVLFSIDLLNPNSLQIISDYKPYQQLFEHQLVKYQFLYPIFSLTYKTDEQFNIQSLNCIASGRYCTFDPDGDDYGTGQDVLEEIIRQLCLKKLNINVFFNYLDLFKDQCKEPYLFEYCFSQLIVLLNYPIQNVHQCYDNSYKQLKSNSNNKLNFYNTLLEEQLEIISQFSYSSFPPVLLNNHFVIKNVTAKNIFINLCESFLNPPRICNNQIDHLQTEDNLYQSNSFIKLLIILLVVLLIFLLIATLIYKKLMQRDQQQQTTEQVHELVTQYIQFVESKASQKKNSQ
ncbi:unnamed protein product [Paramecium sonneborni]|uniref:PA domain-containing protein n=1 Tax=Paramecium sonneborni TaxID=65129 RepID=A0A8S1QW43_9CILI|nr:unnamed protein product [Paramecium sonneborni]